MAGCVDLVPVEGLFCSGASNGSESEPLPFILRSPAWALYSYLAEKLLHRRKHFCDVGG